MSIYPPTDAMLLNQVEMRSRTSSNSINNSNTNGIDGSALLRGIIPDDQLEINNDVITKVKLLSRCTAHLTSDEEPKCVLCYYTSDPLQCDVISDMITVIKNIAANEALDLLAVRDNMKKVYQLLVADAAHSGKIDASFNEGLDERTLEAIIDHFTFLPRIKKLIMDKYNQIENICTTQSRDIVVKRMSQFAMVSQDTNYLIQAGRLLDAIGRNT